MVGVNSAYPGGFEQGVSIRGMPLLNSYGGDIYWVDSGSGANATGRGTFRNPFASIDYAIGRCTANNGDIIMVKPGHAETVSAAAGLDFDVAGVTVMGLANNKADMPQVSFTTAAAADVDFDAIGTTLIGLRFTAAFADVTAALDINVDGLTIANCLFDESGAALNYVDVMVAADGVDDVTLVNNRYIGADAANDGWITGAGTHANWYIADNTLIHSVAQTATHPFIQVATDMNGLWLLRNYMYTESAAVASGFVVLAGTGNQGVAYGNMLVSIDTDATAANFASAFDLTGVGALENYGVADADAGGVLIPNTAEDLT